MCATRVDSAEGTGRLSVFDDLWAKQEGRCALCGESMPRGRFDVPHATVWKKKRPTIPFMNATGTKTAMIDIEVASTARPISSVPLRAASK